MKQKKDRGKRLFEGSDYFKYFNQKGAIIQGRRLIDERLLFEDLWYSTEQSLCCLYVCHMKALCLGSITKLIVIFFYIFLQGGLI